MLRKPRNVIGSNFHSLTPTQSPVTFSAVRSFISKPQARRKVMLTVGIGNLKGILARRKPIHIALIEIIRTLGTIPEGIPDRAVQFRKDCDSLHLLLSLIITVKIPDGHDLLEAHIVKAFERLRTVIDSTDLQIFSRTAYKLGLEGDEALARLTRLSRKGSKKPVRKQK